MPRVLLLFSWLHIESSYNWVTSSHKDVWFCYKHALYCLLSSNKGLDHLLCLKVNYPDHLIPGGRVQEVIGQRYRNVRDRISKFQDMFANACSCIPASDCAVVWAWVNFIRICSLNNVYSVCVTYVQVEDLSSRHLPAAYKPILVPCIYSLLVEHKAADIFLLFYLS